jgi:hypothetical protein
LLCGWIANTFDTPRACLGVCTPTKIASLRLEPGQVAMQLERTINIENHRSIECTLYFTNLEGQKDAQKIAWLESSINLYAYCTV